MKKKLINQDLLTGIDILNTMYGGTIEPQISFSQFPEYRQIEVRVPGIAEQNLHVNVANNKLVIYYELDIDSQGSLIPVPQIVYSKQIPFYIDANNIRATYADDVLTVQLPFNELANGSIRDIPINK